jgi:hypothetical protein
MINSSLVFLLVGDEEKPFYIVAPVFLDRRNLIPVPLFYWKIVYDADADAAIVFVGVNSPEVSDELRSELQLCPDICDSAEWSFPNKKVAEKGFLYCCSYQSFKDSIPWVDFLDNPAILVNRPHSKEIINHVPEPENR